MTMLAYLVCPSISLANYAIVLHSLDYSQTGTILESITQQQFFFFTFLSRCFMCNQPTKLALFGIER
jgi:hypothetical protein